MYNYRMKIQYDGARYDGWQRLGKDDTSNTIECKISEILKKMTEEEIQLFVGMRTERGVHALCQIANFKTYKKYKAIEIKNYLNRYLPRDIAVLRVDEVDERFHSQLNAKSKTYLYKLDTADIADVFNRKYSYHTFEVPDFDRMRAGAEYFIGTHDFKAFTTSKKSKSTERTIEEIQISYEDNTAFIRITANDFLHNMARYMIGTLLDVGNGLKKPEDIRNLLDGRDVGMSFPAESYGLFLENITYPDSL